MTNTLKRSLGTVAALALLVAACGGESSEDASDDDTGATTTTAVDPVTDDPVTDDPATDDNGDGATAEGDEETESVDCDGVASSFTTDGSANADLPDPEVSASCDGTDIVVTSNGIPDYTYVETSPGQPAAQDLEFRIAATPTMASESTAVPLLGTAAVAINGVPIYGPTEGTGGDVLSLTGALSECGSHNGPTGFHMHLLGTSTSTDCLYSPEDVAAGPQLVGYAFDGYPIYTGSGVYESSWELTDESLFASDTWSAHTYVEGSGDLDECNGTTDADGNYAYFTTDTFPYILGCYSGVVDLDAAGAGGAGGAPGGGPPPGAGG